MRMFDTPEPKFTQGRPAGFIIDRDHSEKSLSKKAQQRLLGNMVPPQLSEALVRANLCAPLSQAAD